MPFTFAHPAAIFPFKYLPKKYYSWAGLIIGSIVPDFQAFINLGGNKVLSHSWKGVYTYDLPVGLLLVLIFHYIVRNALIANLPLFLRSRFGIYTKIRNEHYFTKRYIAIIVSLIIGIYTHLIWDRFTHTGTYLYTTDLFGLELSNGQKNELQMLLQWGCSFLGIVILTWLVAIMPISTFSFTQKMNSYWIIAVLVTCMVYYARIQFPYIIEGDEKNIAIGAFLWGVFIASLLYNLKFYHSIVIPRKLKKKDRW